MWKSKVLGILVVLALVGVAQAEIPPVPTGIIYSTTVLTPSEDTYIVGGGGMQGNNYGTETNYNIGAFAPSYALQKFQVTSQYQINSALLNQYLYSSNGNTIFTPYIVTSTWNETTVTWNNRPSISTAQQSTTTTADGWYQWNITDVYRAWNNGSIANYGIQTQSDNIFSQHIYSRESGTNPPNLTVNYSTLSNATGFNWVNTSWSAGAGNVTNSYNVSVNGTWTNGSANTFINITGISSPTWVNMSIYAFNNSGSLSLTPLSTSNFISLSYVPPTPTGLANTTGYYWVNHTWSASSGNVTNLYNVSVNNTWTNGSAATFYNNSNVGVGGWSNVTVYAYNTSNTGALSLMATSQSTQVLQKYTPPAPTGISATTGNFWVNTTWSAGSGNATNLYNVSTNGTWVNGSASTFYNSSGMSAHGWSNISVYAWNSSGITGNAGSISLQNASNNTIIPNNPVSISGILTSYSVIEGLSMKIDATYYDVDGDGISYITNATKGTVNSTTGDYNYTARIGDQGTYVFNITANDGNGSTPTVNFSLTVVNSTVVTTSNLTATEDSAIWIPFETNFGSDTTIQIGDFGGYEWRSYIKFANISTLSKGIKINTANLYLNIGTVNPGGDTIFKTITSVWNASTLLPSNQPTVTSTNSLSKFINTGGLYSWNLTNLTKEWYKSLTTNYGLRWDCGHSCYIRFSTNESSNPPYLSVNYSVPYIITNFQVSESSIPTASGVSRISAVITEHDEPLSNITTEITLNGVSTNYTMIKGAASDEGYTYYYDFATGTPGVYTVSAIRVKETTGYLNTLKTSNPITAIAGVVGGVVQGGAGTGAGLKMELQGNVTNASTLNLTSLSVSGQTINIKTIPTDPLGRAGLNIMTGLGVIIAGVGFFNKKKTNLLVIGLIMSFGGALALGYI